MRVITRLLGRKVLGPLVSAWRHWESSRSRGRRLRRPHPRVIGHVYLDGNTPGRTPSRPTTGPPRVADPDAGLAVRRRRRGPRCRTWVPRGDPAGRERPLRARGRRRQQPDLGPPNQPDGSLTQVPGSPVSSGGVQAGQHRGARATWSTSRTTAAPRTSANYTGFYLTPFGQLVQAAVLDGQRARRRERSGRRAVQQHRHQPGRYRGRQLADR